MKRTPSARAGSSATVSDASGAAPSGRHRHGGDKAIALAIARLDETLRLPVIADGVAYGLETVFNRGIAHSLSRPHLFAQFLLRNHTVAVRQKISKRLEHFWPQSNRLASPAQEITLCVEEAIRKEVTHGLDLSALWCAHSSYDHRTQRSYVRRAIFSSQPSGHPRDGQTVYAYPHTQGNSLTVGDSKNLGSF